LNHNGCLGVVDIGFGFAGFARRFLPQSARFGRLLGELRFTGTGRQGEPQFTLPAGTA
jgi:hypothetical protein